MDSQWTPNILRKCRSHLMILVFFVKITFIRSQSNPCGILTRTASEGEITSPGFPLLYPRNTTCRWTITVPYGDSITLNISHFELEESRGCVRDYLSIYSRVSNTSQFELLWKGCGRKMEILSRTINAHELKIVFVTDYLIELSGFKIKYIGNRCGFDYGNVGCSSAGRVLTAPCGHFDSNGKRQDVYRNDFFTDKNTPQKEQYGSNQSCQWTITAGIDHAIKLTFSWFDVEYGWNDCLFDRVRVYDGPSTASRLHGNYCGTKQPWIMFSSTGTLLVTFESDGSYVRTGFRAFYSRIATKDIPIVKAVNLWENATGSFEAVDETTDEYIWFIKVPLGHTIELSWVFLDQTLMTQNTYEVTVGPSRISSPLKTYTNVIPDSSKFNIPSHECHLILKRGKGKTRIKVKGRYSAVPITKADFDVNMDDLDVAIFSNYNDCEGRFLHHSII